MTCRAIARQAALLAGESWLQGVITFSCSTLKAAFLPTRRSCRPNLVSIFLFISVIVAAAEFARLGMARAAAGQRGLDHLMRGKQEWAAAIAHHHARAAIAQRDRAPLATEIAAGAQTDDGLEMIHSGLTKRVTGCTSWASAISKHLCQSRSSPISRSSRARINCFFRVRALPQVLSASSAAS